MQLVLQLKKQKHMSSQVFYSICLTEFNCKLHHKCVSYVTFQELSILIILDPQGKNGDSSDKNQSPHPFAYPRSKARIRVPSLRWGIVPMFGGGFIHVCGHPRLQWRLLWWRHYHQLTAKKSVLWSVSFPADYLSVCSVSIPSVSSCGYARNVCFSCTDTPTSNVEPLTAAQPRQQAITPKRTPDMWSL